MSDNSFYWEAITREVTNAAIVVQQLAQDQRDNIATQPSLRDQFAMAAIQGIFHAPYNGRAQWYKWQRMPIKWPTPC